MTSRLFVYDLPYSVRTQLCRLLDIYDKWEELGGEHMGFDYTYLQYIRRKPSPTEELLTSWGNQNHTVKELFVLLSKMQFYRAMMLLKDLVDAKYHHLLKEGEELMSQQTFKNLGEPGNPSRVNQRSGYGEPNYALQERLPPQPLPSAPAASSHNAFKNNKDLGLNLDNMNLVNNKAAKKTIHEDKIQNVPYVRIEQQADQNSNEQNNFSSGQAQAAYNPNYNPNLNPRCEPSDMQNMGQHRKLSNRSVASSLMEGCTPQISYEELEAATNGWDTSRILGRGGFGTVYSGSWGNISVAIKKLEPQKHQQLQTGEMNSAQMSEVLRELRHLNSHRHDNILSLYGYSVSENASCLVYQFMANGSLEDRLHCRNNTKPLNWAQRLNIMTGTARGIQFLHSLGEKPLVHGDIKSANILLDKNYEPRIGDFGLAREGPHQQYTHVKVSRVHGTKPYLPDEFLRARQFSVRVDTYSFGVVLFEVATGLRAYDENRKERFLKDYIVAYQDDQLSSLADKKAGPDCCGSAAGLLMVGRNCVVTRPKDRPDMKTVLIDVQQLYQNYEGSEKFIHLARQHSLSPTRDLPPGVRQLIHDEKLNPSSPVSPPLLSPPLPSPPLMFINPHSPQQVIIRCGLSRDEAHWPTKATIQLVPDSVGAMIVQPPPEVTVHPPSALQLPPIPPQQVDSSYDSSYLPALSILGVTKADSEKTENQSTHSHSTTSSHGTKKIEKKQNEMKTTQMTSESIATSMDNQSEVFPTSGPVVESPNQNQPDGTMNFSHFTVSLPEENQSAYLPRLPDLMGS